MNTAITTQTQQDETDIAAATERMDSAIDCLCTLFAWVEPQPSVVIAQLNDEGGEDIDTNGMCGPAASMYDAAGTLELLMLRVIRCENMKELLAS